MAEKAGGLCKKTDCIIHSGQFMASAVHDQDAVEEDEEDDVEVDVEGLEASSQDLSEQSSSSLEAKSSRVPISRAAEKPITFYKFGPTKTRSIAIDVSLGKLNKCINFAYERLTTPRWKFFHGLKLTWKDRLRLNNIIWRSWHMEFVTKQTPKYCCYAVPSEDTHQQKEAAVLEGMYWKRRLDAVCAQYKRWRAAALPKGRAGRIRRPSANPNHSSSSRHSSRSSIQELLPPKPAKQAKPELRSQDTQDILEHDDFDNYFTDRLFDSLNQTSYMFPDPKELNAYGHAKNADFIQPSLITLQPSLEDIMASLDGNYDDDLFRAADNEPVSQTPPPGTSSSYSCQYSQKDYQDAQLLLPSPAAVATTTTALSPLYHPQGMSSQGETPPLSYSQAREAELSAPWTTTAAEASCPNPPSPFSPTSSKAALKIYPPAAQPPKLRGKRARQAASAQAEDPFQHHQQPPPPPSAFSPVASLPGSFPHSQSLPNIQAPTFQPRSLAPSYTLPVLAQPQLYPSPDIQRPLVKKEPPESPGAAALKGHKKPTKRAAADSTMDPTERKRMLHLHAEQSRRSALKTGFDQLEAILPNLPNPAKNTNAAILARASEHIGALKESVGRDGAELTHLRDRVTELKGRIAELQGSLPVSGGVEAGGASSLPLGDGGLAAAYARRRTAEDWRFPILWRLLSPLRASFWRSVEGSSGRELAASASAWAAQNAQLPKLRPELSALLVQLATSAPPILSDPKLLPAALREHFL